MKFFLLLSFIITIIDNANSQHIKSRTKEERERYIKEYYGYQKCLKENMYLDFKYGSRLFKVILGLRGGGVELKCFKWYVVVGVFFSNLIILLV